MKVAPTRAVAGIAPGRYPPNPMASVVLASLGQPPEAWHGTGPLVDAENEAAMTASLTAQQLELIDRA